MVGSAPEKVTAMSSSHTGEQVDPPEGLVVRGSHDRDAFVLSLYGELDIATARVLERKLGMARSSRSQKVVLDLSGLHFIDSAGLHALLQARDELRRSGRDLALRRGPRAVQRVFEVVDADDLFEFDG